MDYIQTTTITTRITAPDLDADGIRDLQTAKENLWKGIVQLNSVLCGDSPNLIVTIEPVACPLERDALKTCVTCKNSEVNPMQPPCNQCFPSANYPLWEAKEGSQ